MTPPGDSPRTELSYDVVLRDGSTARLRLLAPTDAKALEAFFLALAPESRYWRFFRPLKDPTPEVERLLRADGRHAVALVAEAGASICGVANYVRDAANPARAEAAFAIADRLQGRGLGTRMLEVLADVARARGIEAFDAFVLGGNDRMMRVFLDSGFEVQSRLDGGVLHVVFPLSSTDRLRTRSAERSEAAAAASLRAFFVPEGVAVVGANQIGRAHV